MRFGAHNLARTYITYRYKRQLLRQANTTDEQILSLIECNNEEVKQENSNKNPTVNSVQRDYIAGEVSKDITKRILLPQAIVHAHDQGVIHFHDADYYAQHMHNCDLVNLKDMLEKSRKNRDKKVVTADSLDGILQGVEGKNFVKAGWCGCRECEDKVKEVAAATARVMCDEDGIPSKCAICGKPAKHNVYWARAY